MDIFRVDVGLSRLAVVERRRIISSLNGGTMRTVHALRVIICLLAVSIPARMQPWAEKLFNQRPTTAGLAEWTLPHKQRKGPGALVGRVADFCVFFGTDHAFFN